MLSLVDSLTIGTIVSAIGIKWRKVGNVGLWRFVFTLMAFLGLMGLENSRDKVVLRPLQRINRVSRHQQYNHGRQRPYGFAGAQPRGR